MSKSCAVIPSIRNKEGKMEKSKLFQDLNKMFDQDRSLTVETYLKIKSQTFQNAHQDELEFDELGEPTIESIMKTDTQIINDAKAIDNIEHREGIVKDNERVVKPRTPDNLDSIREKANNFNRQDIGSGRYVELPFEDKNGNIGLKISKRTPETTNKEAQMMSLETLNNMIVNILRDNGMSIGSLTELEENLGIDGITDFSGGKKVAEGLVELIRIAKGHRGQEALPEEFAHVIVRALRSSSLMTRLLNNLRTTGAWREVLGEDAAKYKALYKGDEAKLAEEAAGKLMKKHILEYQPVEQSAFSNILRRVIDWFKKTFSAINEDSFRKAIIDADYQFEGIVRNVMNKSLDLNIDKSEINDVLYAVSSADKRLERNTKILEQIIGNEAKRLLIYKKSSKKPEFAAEQELYLSSLKYKLHNGEVIKGISDYLVEANSKLNALLSKLKNINTLTSIQEKASILRQIKSWGDSYGNILDELYKASLDEKDLIDDQFKDLKIHEALNNAITIYREVMTKQAKASSELFVEFMKPYTGKTIEIPFGKYKGKSLKVEDLIQQADTDISVIDLWLESMSNNSDFMLKMMDKAVKHTRAKARERVLEYSRQIKALGQKLRNAGYTDTDWMFDRDEEGNLTGHYISEIDWTAYIKAYNQAMEDINSRYPGELTNAQKYQKYNEIESWLSKNREPDSEGNIIPKASIYRNRKYFDLSDEQREFHKKFLEMKQEFDEMLPSGATRLNNAIRIRKDLIERVSTSGVSELGEAVKEMFFKVSDDTEFGTDRSVMGFNNKETMFLPVYYLKMKDEKLNNLSTDAVSTLIAYADMAVNFDEMSNVIDLLELGRDALRTRKVTKDSYDKRAWERIKSGGTVVSNPIEIDPESSNIVKRLDKFFEMQVYQRYMKDKEIGDTKISKGKLADFVNSYTALSKLAINLLSGISNIATGKAMIRIEAFSGRFFKYKHLVEADAEYSKELPENLGNIGARVKTNKLALFDEMFDVMQEYDSDIKDTDWNKSRFQKMLSTNTLFFLNNAGEHWLQNRTAIAMALAYKMKDANGNDVNLWESLETVYLQEDGSYGTENKGIGAKLKIKEGYTKEDGTEFSGDDIFKFTRKLAAVNQGMHGIYNREDRNAVQQIGLGRMAMMFRKYLVPNLTKMFEPATYNYDMDVMVEGYYRTLGRFLWNSIKDIKEGKFEVIRNYKNLTDTEQHNIIMAGTHLGQFVALAALITFGFGGDDDKLKKSPWYKRMVEYQSRRLYSEIAALTPTTEMYNEGRKLLKSPAAGINVLDDAATLIGLLNPMNYETFGGKDAIITRGTYKGKTKAGKIIRRNIPMYSTIERGIHPEESLAFFKQ